MRPFSPDFFARDPLACARELIGAELVNDDCSGRILETEAYHQIGDPACHLFTRPSARNFARRNPPGTAYVYLNYGVHWLVNVLCLDERTGHAGFVLFRALQPLKGLERMRERRGTEGLRRLCSGPGKLTAALGINGSHHERSLAGETEFCLRPSKTPMPLETTADRRIGISTGKDLLWRFLARDHPGISVPAGKVR
jgi:DNA-3-methyladenine glycosylase